MSIQVGDLQYASPATVSRCGMVFVDPKNLGYKPYWERWMNALPSKGDREEFIKLFDKYVPQCISLILEGIMDGRQGEKLKTILPVTNLNLVSSGETDFCLGAVGSMMTYWVFQSLILGSISLASPVLPSLISAIILSISNGQFLFCFGKTHKQQ